MLPLTTTAAAAAALTWLSCKLMHSGVRLLHPPATFACSFIESPMRP